MGTSTDDKKNAKNDLTPNRWAVGLITIGCFTAATVMWLGGHTTDNRNQLAFAGLIRVGIFMATVWWALPGGGRLAAWAGMSPWTMVFIAVGVFLTPRLKYSGPIVIAMLVLGAFIKPKSKKKPATKKTVPTTARVVQSAEPKEGR